MQGEKSPRDVGLGASGRSASPRRKLVFGGPLEHPTISRCTWDCPSTPQRHQGFVAGFTHGRVQIFRCCHCMSKWEVGTDTV